MNNQRPPQNESPVTKKEIHLLFVMIAMFTAIQLAMNLKFYLNAIPPFTHIVTNMMALVRYLLRL